MSFWKRLFRGNIINTEQKLDATQAPTADAQPTLRNKPEILEQAKAILEPYKRTAYLPITHAQPAGHSRASKIGGLPYLRHADDWPICPSCKNPMQLFLQLDNAKLPEEANEGEGLTQLFYCINEQSNNDFCEYQLEGYDPFSTNSVRRIIEVNGPSAVPSYTARDVLEEKAIIDWEAVDDYPSWDEYKRLGIEMEDQVCDMVHEEEDLSPKEGDKYLGWPFWIQGEEYPEDRVTGSKMEMLFQLDSECNLNYMFGDSGIAHLTQSPDNENELAFSWACY